MVTAAHPAAGVLSLDMAEFRSVVTGVDLEGLREVLALQAGADGVLDQAVELLLAADAVADDGATAAPKLGAVSLLPRRATREGD